MSYLQLAENETYYLAENDPKELYIFVPQGYRGAEKDLYIREDLLDDLSDDQYNLMMYELSSFQNTGLSASATRKARREERRAARKEKKAQRGAGARREARQKRIEARQAGRTQRGGIGGALDKIGGIVGGIFGTNAQDKSLDVSYQDGDFGVTYEDEPSFFERNKLPLLIGGAVIIGGVIYLTMRKK